MRDRYENNGTRGGSSAAVASNGGGAEDGPRADAIRLSLLCLAGGEISRGARAVAACSGRCGCGPFHGAGGAAHRRALPLDRSCADAAIRDKRRRECAALEPGWPPFHF